MLRVTMWINALRRVAGATAIAAGATVLIGWLLDIEFLKSLGPNLVSMKANTALAFVLAGISLLLHASSGESKRRRTAGFLASLVFLIGLITVAEYVFKWDAGIESTLVQGAARYDRHFPARTDGIEQCGEFLLVWAVARDAQQEKPVE